MFTYSRPHKRRPQKPVTKALAKQLKSEDRLRRFDQAMAVFFGLMGLIVLFQAL